jgi:low affinity Fe/Cu permease
MQIKQRFSQWADSASHAAGKPIVFAGAILSVLLWLITGPVFNYSDTWQLIINTSTTIITFLMVFLIQNSQNRDNAALQVKLDELIRVSVVQNRFIGIERLTDDELEELREKCEARAKAEADADQAIADIGKKAEKAAEQA